MSNLKPLEYNTCTLSAAWTANVTVNVWAVRCSLSGIAFAGRIDFSSCMMHSSQLLFSNPTAVSFDQLRKRHTKQEGGLVDVMMLIAVECQH